MSVKRALVTGGSRGIGRETVKRFDRAGWDVVIHYNQSLVPAEKLAEQVDGELIQADLSEPADLIALKKDIKQMNLNVLVNNAGVAMSGEPGTVSTEQWDKTLQVNLTSAFELSRTAAENMDAGGTIVNVTSIRGLPYGTRPGIVDYCTSKAGLESVTRMLAQHYAPDIRVNAVAPGFTDTDMTAGVDEDTRQDVIAQTPMNRFGKPEEIAEAVYFLASDQCPFINGETLVVDGGLSITD